jgi:hypothetical protein
MTGILYKPFSSRTKLNGLIALHPKIFEATRDLSPRLAKRAREGTMVAPECLSPGHGLSAAAMILPTDFASVLRVCPGSSRYPA